ncbi:DUF732 domain-containing protein [Mycobacterium sp.]|uniref:DUF732 domain-containing protein n=1 Tax=Mycobacterium sp. TaxID=1785 RepID=UPI003F9EAAC1
MNRIYRIWVAALLAVLTGLLLAGVSSASPNPQYCAKYPSAGICSGGPLTYCGAHTDALDCWGVARGTCVMLLGGDTSGYVVRDIAQHSGITLKAADQVMDAAMDSQCPGLIIDLNGVASF